jgi:hypothetical protein
MLLALSLVGTTVTTAHALPAVSWTKIYFSDEGHQNVVGERSLYCDGSRFSEGTTTAVFEWAVYESCSTSGQPLGSRRYECAIFTNGAWSTVYAPSLGCF